MDQFEQYLQYHKEVAEAKLKIIDRLQRQTAKRPGKRTSKIDIARHVLQTAGRAMHVSEIIRAAKQDYGIELNRDSIVSALLKKVNAGQTFMRTAPNTFVLKDEAKEGL